MAHYVDDDFQLARRLQRQFEAEQASTANNRQKQDSTVDLTTTSYARKNNNNGRVIPESGSLVDPSWELIDPTPNIYVLFQQFDRRFFWSKLVTVCVDWSKRMTSCAGICSYQGRGGMCKITLSEPLLKLRPRKDLVETLLHEMIHAYLFVTHNNRDRDGHGPEFHKHMWRINKEVGTNITVYHSFHDEVRLYKQHWWKCNGPCQTRHPFFGMVRRAMNRAPGPNDRWWAEHQATCNGTFIKIKEPEKMTASSSSKATSTISKAKPTMTSPSKCKDIRSFFPVLSSKNNSTVQAGALTAMKTSLTKIFGMSDLSTNTGCNNNGNANVPRQQTGLKSLNNGTFVVTSSKKSTDSCECPNASGQKRNNDSFVAFNGKGHVASSTGAAVTTKTATSTGAVRKHTDNRGTNNILATVRNHWADKFSSANIVGENRPNSHNKVNNDNNNASVPQPKRAKIVDNLMTYDSSVTVVVHCPVCDVDLEESDLNRHLDFCLAEPDATTTENGPSHRDPEASQTILCLVCDKMILRASFDEHLDECMSDRIFDDSNITADQEVEEIPLGQEDFVVSDVCEKDDDTRKKYNCPVCMELYELSEMSNHLDVCFSNEAKNSSGDGTSFIESFLSVDDDNKDKKLF